MTLEEENALLRAKLWVVKKAVGLSTPAEIKTELLAYWAKMFLLHELSESQIEVAEMLLVGYREKQIADELKRNFASVRAQASRIRHKFKVEGNGYFITFVFLGFLKDRL